MPKLRVLSLAILGTVMLGGWRDDEEDDTQDGDGGDGVGEEVTFNVNLTKEDEVPLCNNAGANATGAAVIRIPADNSKVIVSNFTFNGLSGPANAAHIHYAAGGAGAMGGPVF